MKPRSRATGRRPRPANSDAAQRAAAATRLRPSGTTACACGGGCPRCHAPQLPASIRVGASDDPLELQAQRLAATWLAAPPPPDDPRGRLPAIARNRAGQSMVSAGRPIPADLRALLEARLGVDLRAVELHQDDAASALARAVGARAFTLGTSIVLGDASIDLRTRSGQQLLVHEIAHVLQQQRAGLSFHEYQPGPLLQTLSTASAHVLRRVPGCGAEVDAGVTVEEEEFDEEDESAYNTLPDDERVDRGIAWPDTCQKNLANWDEMELVSVWPNRYYDAFTHPKAWANRTRRAQQIMYDSGIRSVEGVGLRRDAVFGPRTFLAMHQVALDETHPARAAIQGLGFDLDAIRDAEAHVLRARALARRPEFLHQVPFQVLGEVAVNYYDAHFGMVLSDQDILDQILFAERAPEDFRRADRIELLTRLYGRNEFRLHGTAALVRVHRDFIHSRIDVSRAVEQDRRASVERRHWFSFVADSPAEANRFFEVFGLRERFNEAAARLTADQRAEVAEAIALLEGQTESELPAERTELAAILVAIYLPTPDPAERDRIVGEYQVEKAEREAREAAIREEHNRGVAHERADRLIAIFDDEETFSVVRDLALRTELKTNLADLMFFDLVLDDLLEREGDRFNQLFEEVEDIGGDLDLSLLMELCLAGRYADHPRVRQSLGVLASRSAELQDHGYIVTDGGAVLLNGDIRLEVGEVAGDKSTLFLSDEDREQLRPDAQERLNTELERESREYIARLLAGEEQERSQEDVGDILLSRAWAAGGFDPDRDIEDVEFQESIRLRGVRRAAASPDGITRYEVQFERVQRIVTDSDPNPAWGPEPAESVAWRSASDFELEIFFLKHSQIADVVQTAAIVVAVGAVVVVAWEVGAIAALVSAGGGAVPVTASIAFSVAFYLLTHQRWTLEGVLIAGVSGYLGAVGFKLFAPAGAAAARLVLPATLEQIAFRQVVAAWMVRHGVTGALTGVTVGPADLFMRDLIRVARAGGSFSPVGDYLSTAAWGLVLGAVFEIGGSAILSPIFQAADTTVLARLTDVADAVRTSGISPSRWLAESAGALSNVKRWLGDTMEDAMANGVYEAMQAKLVEAGRAIYGSARAARGAYARGLRVTLHRQVLELAGNTLSHSAVEGLERILRLSIDALDDDAMANLLRQVNRTPERVEPWLRFLGGVDEALVEGMITRNELRALADAEAALALSTRRTPTEVGTLLTTRFNSIIPDLDAFAVRLNALDDTVADEVLELLRTRGTAVTPRALLRMVESGAGLGEDLLTGLARLLDRADAGKLHTILDDLADPLVRPDNQLADYLRRAGTATPDDFEAMLRTIDNFEERAVAWSASLTPTDAEAFLTSLSPMARGAILDIPVERARELVTAVTPARINRALDAAAHEGLSGSHLLALHDNLPLVVINDMLDTAGARVGMLRTLREVGSRLGTAGERVGVGPALTAQSIVLDTNAIIGIEMLLGGTPFTTLPPHRAAAIDALRTLRGLPAYADPGVMPPTFEHIAGAGADLRANLTASAEVLRGEVAGGVRVLDNFQRAAAATAHPDYADVVGDMAARTVGAGRGALDRVVVADAMFADVAGGVTPTLVTVDRGVVIPLAEHFAVGARFVRPGPNPTLADVAAHFGANHFTIDIRGHLLTIRFGG